MTKELPYRVKAAQAALDRFVDKPLIWGRSDCAILTRHTGRQLGNRIRVLDAAKYRTEVGAAKYLRSLGFNSLSDVLDAQGFMPIPPAMRLPADVVSVAGDGELWDCALTIAVTATGLLGFVNGVGTAFEPNPDQILRAWRMPLCRR